MARKIVVGIDVGTSLVRVVVAECFPNAEIPRIIGTGVAESRGLRHGYIIQPEEATKSIEKAIKEAEKNSRFTIKKALLSLGGISLDSVVSTGSAVISRGDSEVSEIDVTKAIEESRKNLSSLNNKKILKAIPISFKIDGKDVHGRAVGMKGLKLEVKTLFITCLKQHMEDMVSVVEDAGVQVTEVIASPLAASFVAVNKRQKTVGCAVVNIGAETVSLIVFENDTPISLHVFQIGSTDITSDIALGLRVSLEEAEIIKRGEKREQYPRKRLEEIIEARLTDIFELIDNHLKKIGRSGLLPAGIFITGGGSGIATVEDLARGSLALPVKVLGKEIMDTSSGKPKMLDSTWFVSYGLCVMGKDDEEKELSLWSDISSEIKNFIKSLLP